MSTELTNKNSLLINLRVINFFVSILAIVLIVWMTIGEKTLSPLCELKIFADRKESCFRNGAIEMRDRASIIILAVLTLAVIISINIRYIKDKIIEQNFLTSSVDKFAFVTVIAAIASRDYYPSFADWSLNEFSGFGFDVAFVTSIFSLLSVYYLTDKVTIDKFRATQSNWKFRTVCQISVLIVLGVFYVPAVLPLRSNIVLGDITTHVFNELLAPLAGNFPGADSIPQYNSLLGFPILIVSQLTGLKIAISIIPLWISVINLGILATLTAIWLRLFPNAPKSVALLGVSSIILARSSNLPGAYTVASFPSWTVRMALPALVALLIHISVSQRRVRATRYWTAALGATTSLALINNFEFGITCTIAIVFSILILVISRKVPWSFLLIHFFSMTATIFLIYLLYRINGKTLKMHYLSMIAREFGAIGFLSWPMPIFGFFLVVYVLAGIAIVFSVSQLMNLPSSPLREDKKNSLADVALAIFAGTWTLASLVFYSARSVDGNLRILFIPALIAFLTTLKLILPYSLEDTYQSILKSTFLPLAAVVVLPIALLINAPDPISNWSRIMRQGDGPKWSWSDLENSPLAKSYIELSKLGIVNIGIMGSNGNAISVVTGAKNILVVNALADYAMSDVIKEEICKNLEKAGVDFILIEGNFRKSGDYPCIGMTNPSNQVNDTVTLFEYAPLTPD